MKLSLACSPCPNDTFIFDAMLHQKIDTHGLSFDLEMADVEKLNKKAFNGDTDIIKLSFHAFAFLTEKYELLDSGSALGNNCGPILISKEPGKELSFFKNKKIAIPGKLTTANFLLNLALEDAENKIEMLFSEIEDAVINGSVDAGLIIHESRFTYLQKGLHKVIDLGEYWESLSGAPIPLGGIAVKRSLPHEIKHKINKVLKQSVSYAMANPLSGYDFIKFNAQEINEKVIYDHINLYVNKFSLNLGIEGKKAIELLFDKAKEKNIIPVISNNLFLT
ncbi:MAG: 1,4-dihydroxy-6-naphthoate synthase [Bacteroidetes bacterium]|nr:1,4-dihydroxy-6-naphthoate synthase [Bacteroidota bacterium]HET6245603.1 1,4-dihydroxy-6-naphthoate synthase [Bacteroidia bacterium]